VRNATGRSGVHIPLVADHRQPLFVSNEFFQNISAHQFPTQNLGKHRTHISCACNPKSIEACHGPVVRYRVCFVRFLCAHTSISYSLSIVSQQTTSSTHLSPATTMTASKSIAKSAVSSNATKKSRSSNTKDDILGAPKLYHKTGNSWQQPDDLAFLVSNLQAYKLKAARRKGKEFAIQCADQYFKAMGNKCKTKFDPSLDEGDEIADVEAWSAWRKKRTQVPYPCFPWFHCFDVSCCSL
jgi:hypothetical protein